MGHALEVSPVILVGYGLAVVASILHLTHILTRRKE
jgi:hypothetical protein